MTFFQNRWQVRKSTSLSSSKSKEIHILSQTIAAGIHCKVIKYLTKLWSKECALFPPS